MILVKALFLKGRFYPTKKNFGKALHVVTLTAAIREVILERRSKSAGALGGN